MTAMNRSAPADPGDLDQRARDYARVAVALEYLVAHSAEQPRLAQVATAVGLTEHHFQRLFTRWAGISPKKFLNYLTLESAKKNLRRSASVLDAALEAGLSGPGRLHDLFVTTESVTPGEYKSGGEGLRLSHGLHSTPLGPALLVASERGLCALSFPGGEGSDRLLEQQQRIWHGARMAEDREVTGPLVRRIFGDWPRPGSGAAPVRLLLRGTPFQLKVWEALLRVPKGALVTYGQLAQSAGLNKGASRAVGQAVGANPVAVLIPCHRVIQASGVLGGYRWGQVRKSALIGLESDDCVATAGPAGRTARAS